MRRRRIVPWIFALAATSLLGVLVSVIFQPREQLPPSQTLSDGSVVRISKVSYGKSFTIPPARGNWLQRLAGEYLPEKIASRFGIHAYTVTLAADSTFIFIETTRTNKTFSAAPRAMAFTFNTSVAVTDDVGNEFSLGGPVFQGMKPSTTNTLVEVFHLPLVSHLATSLNLHLAQSDSFPVMRPSQTSEFVIANPAPHSKPKWNAGHFPLTNFVNKLTVVFAGIQSEEDPNIDFGSRNGGRRSVPRVVLFENGVPSTNWGLAKFSVADEDGNTSAWPGFVSPLETRKWQFELEQIMPVYPSDRLRIENVSVPDGTNQFSPARARWQNFTVEIYNFANGDMSYRIDPPMLGRKARLTIQYKDENGNLHTHMDARSVPESGAGLGFPLFPKSVKSVDFIFDFPGIMTWPVEFVAQAESGTNSAAKK